VRPTLVKAGMQKRDQTDAFVTAVKLCNPTRDEASSDMRFGRIKH
jgi:hypothetical protein